MNKANSSRFTPIVVFYLMISEAFGQAVITPSASSGYICNGGYVSFNCRATGHALAWSYNGTSLIYPSVSGEDVLSFPGSSNIYTSLLSSDNGVHISELVFLDVSDVSSLSINCIVDGIPTPAVVTVIRGGVAPENMKIPDNYTKDNNAITISWSHPLQHLVDHFEIMLDHIPHAPVIHGSVTQTQIQLRDCKSHLIHVVAVDVCNNTSPSNMGDIICVQSSESLTTSTESMTALDRQILATAKSTLVTGIVLIVLSLAFFIVDIFGVTATIVWLKKKVCCQKSKDLESADEVINQELNEL